MHPSSQGDHSRVVEHQHPFPFHKDVGPAPRTQSPNLGHNRFIRIPESCLN